MSGATRLFIRDVNGKKIEPWLFQCIKVKRCINAEKIRQNFWLRFDHFWPFQSDFWSWARYLDQFLAYISPFWLPKMAWMASKDRQSLTILYCWGSSGTFLAKKGVKSALKGLQWCKIAPEGPNRYSLIILFPTENDLGPFRPFWAAKKVKNRL